MSTTEAGDLLATEYQYEFRNLLFGSMTDFITTKVTGLHGLPSVRNSDTDKFNDHGATPGLLTMAKRTIGIDMSIVGAAGEDIESKLSLARSTFQLPRRRFSRESERFVFWRPGDVKKFINARCERRDFTSDFSTARGLAQGSVDLVAPNPLIYSLQEHTRTLTLASGVTSGQVIIFNAGDHEDGATCSIRIDGPATDFSITSQTDENRALQTSAALAAGHNFVYDQMTMEAFVDGLPQANVVQNDSQEWLLLPGNNVIVFTRSGANAAAPATMTITWRDVWQ